MPGKKKTSSANTMVRDTVVHETHTAPDAIQHAEKATIHPLGASRHHFPELTHVGQVLQQPTRFGHSAVWQLMQDYYESRSIKAWNEVPFLITCSVNMADAYSDFIIGYWQDLPDNTPLHMVELSTGSGRLSFLMLKLLNEKIKRTPALRDRSFRYVMTDCAQHNIDFWMSHPNFQPYIQQGQLDFARFNPMSDTAIHMLVSGDTLQDTAVVGIANYCFDTLANDYFQVRQHTLYETLVELSLITPDADSAIPTVVTRNTVKPEVTYQPAQANYYPYPIWNAVLAHQAEQYFDASFYFPMGGLSAMEVLKASSNGHFMLLSSDKGYVKKECHVGLENPDCAFHGGAFSVMVNYDVILDWFHMQNAFTASSVRDSALSLETVVGVLGDHAMPHLQQATYWHLERTNTIAGSWELLLSVSRLDAGGTHEKNRKIIQQILGGLRASLADPYMMADVAPTLALMAESIGTFTRKDIIRLASRAWELYYPFPGEPNLAYKLGVLFLCMGDFEKVLACTAASIQLYPPDARLYGLMGRAYEKLHRYRLAMDCYHKALEMDPNAEIPNERLNALELLLEQNATDEDFLRALSDYNASGYLTAIAALG
jgi:hypothetical protein